jgi:hypothetical protein
VFIFIQLLLAEGQEQNSDLTEVYIIFIQKSTFFIHPQFFPNLAALDRSAEDRALSKLQITGYCETFCCVKRLYKSRFIFPENRVLG